MYKWNYKIVLFIAVITAFSTLAVAAQQKIWSVNSDNRMTIITDKAVERQTFPTEFKLFDLNIEPLREQLFSVVDSGARQNTAVIQLPNADGGMEYFEVYETSNFDPELQARVPEIRAFSGHGLTDKYATLKLSISPQGIQTMVFRADKASEYIEPYSADHNTYAVFSRQRERGGLPWACSTKDVGLMQSLDSKVQTMAIPESSSGELKTMRLAQSNNGEYANFFGATTACTVADKNIVLAAFNGTLTRSNGVYEKDLGIHFNLIANTTAVIYCDPATDPYTTLGSWNGQLQTALNTNIGAANYDLGHMFGASGGGGNAGCIGCVCNDANKGSGITSPADGIPMGDNFDIDYVVHEVGHQIGANHSFSWSNEGSGVNVEVGSGITIMGYAGITSQDVAPHSIDTFHAANIAQIQSNMASKTCPVNTVMGAANNAPVVASVPNYTIPITTPFELTASATDAQNDPLTYQWEQMDVTTTTGNSSVAAPAKLTGPNWLSFLPTSSPTRMFPRLSTVQAGLFVTPVLPGGDAIANIEALSSVSRTLNFRVTVRDNHPYVASTKVGQTQFTNTLITVTNTAGPFKVTSPNTNVNWAGNSNQTVTWDVNNTNTGLVNVANVKILFSSDGGATFPTVLAASTPNDGSQSVLVPSLTSNQARIRVEAIGNIFFDMSDVNFSTTFAPIRSRADFDGDGKTDLSIFRDSDGGWYLRRSTAGDGGIALGQNGDIPVPGDYDNDGKTDAAIYRPGASGLFYMFRSSNSTVLITQWGVTGDVPVVGDYNGDGNSDFAVFRPSNSGWYITLTGGGTLGTTFGQSGDLPVVGDFDGDSKTDYSVYRNGGWYILQSSAPVNPVVVSWGLAGDITVPADYDGDAKDDIAVYRPSNGYWYILNSSGGMTFTPFGISTDVPVPGDYDGDGKDDVAVYRSGIWYENRSTAGLAIAYWGNSTDRAVPRFYRP